MTKFEFHVNPFDFGDDAIIENNDGDVLMEEDIEQFIDSEGRNINWLKNFMQLNKNIIEGSFDN